MMCRDLLDRAQHSGRNLALVQSQEDLSAAKPITGFTGAL
jgi:hypothetical protein